jgi:hypothetical protein
MSCHAAVAALIAIADQLLSKSNCRRWVKDVAQVEKPAVEAVRREAEEDWG